VKRFIPLIAVLLFAVPSFALDNANRGDRPDRAARTVIVVDDVIRMAQAGVSDDAIIDFVRNTREPFDINADDLIAMTNAHVSERVMKYVQEEAAARRDYNRRETRSTVYVAPYPYYYDPFYYPYDPLWYGPRVGVGFGFGFGRHFGGGRFHGRR
jgi:hypothetical protein